MDSSRLLRLGVLFLAGAVALPAPARDAPAPDAGACPDRGKEMVFGYFDHTAAWYRGRPKFSPDQTIAHTRRGQGRELLVVLYSDISASREGAKAEDNAIAGTRARIEERAGDIADYLKAAERSKRVRVLLQVPPELARRWTDGADAESVLQEFVQRWSREPALAGFYVFDEPELAGIPARTLQAMREVIRRHAPEGRNLAAISVANSAVDMRKPALRDYLQASPAAFDVILVNRYPVFRAYGGSKAGGPADFGAKLGLDPAKAKRENLADNEFANLEEYRESIAAAVGLPGLAGRPLYASVQAYGLRDDCDGADCLVRNERKPHRSPTWSELLLMVTSAWMSGSEGAVMYSHYFSLYDRAMRKRLANLEAVMATALRTLPDCGPTPTARFGTRRGGANEVLARYASSPDGGKPSHLIVLQSTRRAGSIEVDLGNAAGLRAVEELRFDVQGNASSPVARPLERRRSGALIKLESEGMGARIFRLIYE